MLPRPIGSQPHYGEHLGDARYWGPYVSEVLTRHRLPVEVVEAPFVGSFPTFLAGDLVVKLFGEGFDGARSFAVERAMHELLSGHREIRAPSLVAAGHFFEDDGDGFNWPYLVTERLTGIAIRDATLPTDVRLAVAAELGELVALVHALPAPEAVTDRHLLPELRAAAPSRLERFGLPHHLVEQAPDFLADASDERVLVHADITADHVFVHGGRLAGVIDWGDSIVADRWYELVAVAFDGLRCEGALLTAFLDSYGWKRGPDFPRRALQGVLEFQFNAIGSIAGLVDLDGVGTLDELAHLLFADA